MAGDTEDRDVPDESPEDGESPKDIARRVTAEVEQLHDTFERWFQGELDDLSRVEAALSPDFGFVTPRGDIIDRDTVMAGLAAGRGSRHIRIEIRQVAVRRYDSTSALATYEEWHHHADYTTTRCSSVTFEFDVAGPNGVRWRHLHESWITPPPTWQVPDR